MKIKLSVKRRAVNIIVAILTVCCFIIGAGFVYAENVIGNINYEQADSKDMEQIVASGTTGNFDFGNISADNLYHDPKVLNIMVLSLDNHKKISEPDDTSGRSDSMMMLSIDTRNEQIKMTSFMRDLLVDIPGYGFDRLNAAFTYGGPSLTLAAIENNFRVDIDRYVLIDFKKFAEIIDTVGGVDLEISQDEADIINAESGEKKAPPVQAGVAHMTGKQARMYARIRKIDDDFQRTQRQRNVVSALVDKLKDTDLFTLNGYLSDILGMITTDMSKDEVLGIVANMMSYLSYEMKSARLPADGAYYNETVSLYGTPAQVLIPNLETSVELLAKYVYGKDNVPALKGTYTLPQYGGYYMGPSYESIMGTTDGSLEYSFSNMPPQETESSASAETSSAAMTADHGAMEDTDTPTY